MSPTTTSPTASPIVAAFAAKAVAGGKPAASSAGEKKRTDALGKLWLKAQANPELAFLPIVLIGMTVVHTVRRKRSLADDFVLPEIPMQTPAESDLYEMQHTVHALSSEEFELLGAMIYQRQGYRVSMPAGLSGGRGIDFTLTRKAERILVQCKKLSQDHRISVERLREFHDLMTASGAPKGMYVASCGLSWDARNFAKAKGLTAINARTLDALLSAAKESPKEDVLAVANWASKVMSKVQLTPPLCPACEAAMDEVQSSNGAVWVCTQRPECRGRRNTRKLYKTEQPESSNVVAEATANA